MMQRSKKRIYVFIIGISFTLGVIWYLIPWIVLSLLGITPIESIEFGIEGNTLFIHPTISYLPYYLVSFLSFLCASCLLLFSYEIAQRWA